MPDIPYSEEEIELLRYCNYRGSIHESKLLEAIRKDGTSDREAIGLLDTLRDENLLDRDLESNILITDEGREVIHLADEVQK